MCGVFEVVCVSVQAAVVVACQKSWPMWNCVSMYSSNWSWYGVNVEWMLLMYSCVWRCVCVGGLCCCCICWRIMRAIALLSDGGYSLSWAVLNFLLSLRPIAKGWLVCIGLVRVAWRL